LTWLCTCQSSFSVCLVTGLPQGQLSMGPVSLGEVSQSLLSVKRGEKWISWNQADEHEVIWAASGMGETQWHPCYGGCHSAASYVLALFCFRKGCKVICLCLPGGRLPGTTRALARELHKRSSSWHFQEEGSFPGAYPPGTQVQASSNLPFRSIWLFY
jgi:hypothetical protein